MKRHEFFDMSTMQVPLLSSVQMHWICPLYQLSACWAQQVERIWTLCWEVLSGVESCWVKCETGQTFCSTWLNISFVSRSSMCGSTKSSAFAEQRSTCWAYASAVPSVSEDSQPWFNMSLGENFGMLNMLSHCWGYLNTLLNSISTNTQQVESLHSGQIQCIFTLLKLLNCT